MSLRCRPAVHTSLLVNKAFLYNRPSPGFGSIEGLFMWTAAHAGRQPCACPAPRHLQQNIARFCVRTQGTLLTGCLAALILWWNATNAITAPPLVQRREWQLPGEHTMEGWHGPLECGTCGLVLGKKLLALNTPWNSPSYACSLASAKIASCSFISFHDFS